MKYLERLPLPPSVEKELREYQELGESWEDKRRAASVKTVRETLQRMATGRNRCMYCEDSEGSAIDHFWPRKPYPERTFEWKNMLLACSICNSNYKRDQFPVDEKGCPLLVDPTSEDPHDHLLLNTTTGDYAPRSGSEKGRRSIEVFQLLRRELSKGRRDAWRALKYCYLPDYARYKRVGSTRAGEIEEIVRGHPFASVLSFLLQIARTKNAKRILGQECIEALRECPEIFDWD